jgi:hypothetical protein
VENSAFSSLPIEEYRINLARDGGRRVMYGGNPYEDDLEPDGTGSLLLTASDQTPAESIHH